MLNLASLLGPGTGRCRQVHRRWQRKRRRISKDPREAQAFVPAVQAAHLGAAVVTVGAPPLRLSCQARGTGRGDGGQQGGPPGWATGPEQ